jgi:hypothetical protein
MRVFIVYCHSSEDSFTRHVRDVFIKGILDCNPITPRSRLRQNYPQKCLGLVDGKNMTEKYFKEMGE